MNVKCIRHGHDWKKVYPDQNLIDSMKFKQSIEEFRYKLTRQEGTSSKFGNCEICGKFVSDIYLQTQYRQTPTGEAREGDAFGHKDCLMSIRTV